MTVWKLYNKNNNWYLYTSFLTTRLLSRFIQGELHRQVFFKPQSGFNNHKWVLSLKNYLHSICIPPLSGEIFWPNASSQFAPLALTWNTPKVLSDVSQFKQKQTHTERVFLLRQPTQKIPFGGVFLYHRVDNIWLDRHRFTAYSPRTFSCIQHNPMNAYSSQLHCVQ